MRQFTTGKINSQISEQILKVSNKFLTNDLGYNNKGKWSKCSAVTDIVTVSYEPKPQPSVWALAAVKPVRRDAMNHVEP